MAMEVRRVIGDAHDLPVLCAAYNRSRREVYSGAQDALIKAWDADSGRPLRVMAGHKGWVTDLCFVPSVHALFSCSTDGSVRVWSEKGRAVQCVEFGEPRGQASAAAAHAAAAPASAMAAAEAARAARTRSDGPVFCLAWSHKRRLLVAGGNGVIHIYKCKTPAELRRQEVARTARGGGGGGGGYSARAFGAATASDADGTAGFASGTDGSSDGDAQRCVLTHFACVRSHGDIVRGLCVNESGSKLFSTGFDRAICVYDIERPHDFLKVENCHDGAICALALDTEHHRLVTGANDGSFKVWSQEGRCLDTFLGPDTVTGLAYVPATRNYWIASESGRCTVYDPRSPMDISGYVSATSSLGDFAAIQHIHQPPDASDVLVGLSSQRQLVMWQFNPCAAQRVLTGHADWVEALCVVERSMAYDSHAEGGNWGKIAAADVGDDGGGGGEPADGLPGGRKRPRETIVFSAGADGVLLRWQPSPELNTDVYTCVEELAGGHRGGILCLAHCAELDLLLTGSEDASVRVWHLDGREELGAQTAARNKRREQRGLEPPAGPAGRDNPTKVPDVLLGHEGQVSCLAALEGAVLASAGADCSLRFWDLRTRHEIACLARAHEGPVAALCYGAERAELASCGPEAVAKVWCTRSHSLKYVLPAEGAQVTCLGFVPAGVAAQCERGHRRLQQQLQLRLAARARAREAAAAESEQAGHRAAGAAAVIEAPAEDDGGVIESPSSTEGGPHAAPSSGHWVTAADDGVVRFWDCEKASVVWSLPFEGASAAALFVDASNAVVLLVAQDRRVQVVDLVGRATGRAYAGHTDAVRCIARVEGRGHYLTGSWDRTVRVWASAAAGRGVQVRSKGALGEDAGEGEEETGAGEDATGNFYASSYEAEHPLVPPRALRTDRGVRSLLSRMNAAAEGAGAASGARGDEEAATRTALGGKLADLEGSLQHRYFGGPPVRRKVDAKVTTSSSA